MWELWLRFVHLASISALGNGSGYKSNLQNLISFIKERCHGMVRITKHYIHIYCENSHRAIVMELRE